MKISKKGLDFIKAKEGLRLQAYKCPAGVWTIGYGSTYYANGKRVQPFDTIMEVEAESLLKGMVDSNYALPVDKMTRDDITQNQFDALVSLAYNIGAKAFQNSTVLRRVNKNPNDPTIAAAFMMWNKVHNPKTGELEVSKGLTARRKQETKLYFS